MSVLSWVHWKLTDPGYLRRQAHEMSDGVDSDLGTGLKNLDYHTYGNPVDEQEDDGDTDVDSVHGDND